MSLFLMRWQDGETRESGEIRWIVKQEPFHVFFICGMADGKLGVRRNPVDCEKGNTFFSITLFL